MPSSGKIGINEGAATMVEGNAYTSTVTGSGVDTIDYDGLLTVIQSVGVVSGTSPTLDGKIQSSDTSGGTYADITGATFTQVTASTNTQRIAVDISGHKRFIRYVGTIAGTSPNFRLGVVFRGAKKYV